MLVISINIHPLSIIVYINESVSATIRQSGYRVGHCYKLIWKSVIHQKILHTSQPRKALACLDKDLARRFDA